MPQRFETPTALAPNRQIRPARSINYGACSLLDNHVPYAGYDPETQKWQNTVLHYVQCVETWTDAAGDHQSTWTWVSG